MGDGDGGGPVDSSNRRVNPGRRSLDGIVQRLGDGVVVVDGDGWIRFRNGAAAAMLGPAGTGEHPDRFPWRVSPGGTAEVALPPDSPAPGRIIELRTTETDWEGGRALLVALHDVTAHKERERALSIAQFAIERSVDAIAWTNRDGRFLRVNDALCRELGYARGELLRMSMWDVDPGCSPAGWETDWLELRAKGSLVYESALRAKGGRLVPVEIAANYQELEGEPTNCAFVRNITERKRAEERLHRSLFETIATLARTIEQRDPYTAGHQLRVAELSRAIGREIAWDDERLIGLEMGALVHDIGKIRIPSEILTRPGRFTHEEYQLVRTHTRAGDDILRGLDLPWPIADIVLTHHERLDGSGYPYGLRGDQIIPEARVVAVADVVEAISAHRPYRAGRGLAPALAVIEGGRSTLFDAEIVDVCIGLFRENRFRWAAPCEAAPR